MRCEKHPELDAVGTCVYCGRGICDQCKIRVNELLHCKECAAAGRVLGGRQPVQAPPMMMYQMIPAPPVVNETYIPPEPAGPPNGQLFMYGLLGAIIAIILSIVCLVGALLVFVFQTLFSYASLMLSFIMLLLAVGYHGFHRNYGVVAAGNVAWVLMGLSLTDAILWIYVIVSGETTICYVGGIISSMLLGMGLIASASPLTAVSYRIRPGHVSRKDLQSAREVLLFAGILFLSVVGTMLIGWILLVVGLMHLTGAFMHAPLPGESDAPRESATYDPSPAPSAVVNYVEEETSRTPNTIIERADDK